MQATRTSVTRCVEVREFARERELALQSGRLLRARCVHSAVVFFFFCVVDVSGVHRSSAPCGSKPAESQGSVSASGERCVTETGATLQHLSRPPKLQRRVCGVNLRPPSFRRTRTQTHTDTHTQARGRLFQTPYRPLSPFPSHEVRCDASHNAIRSRCTAHSDDSTDASAAVVLRSMETIDSCPVTAPRAPRASGDGVAPRVS